MVESDFHHARYGGRVLLAMDTATPMTTVALVRDDEVLAERQHVDARRHAEVLSSFVREVVLEAGCALQDVSAVVVGVGPGAFTGLRVGLVTARTLGMALEVPVHGVVTLDAMAFAHGGVEPFAVVTDARRREVFWATYTNASTRLRGPFVGPPGEAVSEIGEAPVVGAASTPFADQFPHAREPQLPSAGAMARFAGQQLAAGRTLLAPDPLYLRRPDVSVSTGPKSVLT